MTRLQDARCRVLVVDDNKDSADSTAMLLRKEDGYDVQIAYDGQQALKAFDEFDPDVALLDLALPRVNGFDVAQVFKKKKPGIKLVAITGLALPEDVRRCKEVGFDYHFAKPLDPRLLEQVVRNGCDEVALDSCNRKTE